MQSLQARYAPNDICFGCGQANEKGLRIESYVDGDVCRATYRVQEHHQAFPGMVNGGIIGALLDCHGNWTAAHAFMIDRGEDQPPCTVTANFTIELKRPTPTDATLELVARAVEVQGSKCRVEGTLSAHGEPCATLRALFVAVKPGHPAYYHRGN